MDFDLPSSPDYQIYQESQNNEFLSECKKKIKEQEILIDSLRTRLEILENDFFIIKDQEIKKLRQDFNELLIEMNIKRTSENSFNDENLNQKNDCEDSIYSHGNLVKNDEIMDSDNHKSNMVAKGGDNKSKKTSSSKQHKKTEKLQDVPTYTITIDELIKKYSDKIGSQNIQQKQKENSLSNTLEISSNSSSLNNNNNNNSLQSPNNPFDSSLEINNSLFQKNQNSKIEQLNSQIQQIINRRKSINKKVLSKNFKVLMKSFTINDFIKYTKTNHFDSLDDDPKKILNNIICLSLLKDFNQENVILSQNLEEYTKIGIIPELPLEYSNYTEYARSTKFNQLSKCFKKRIRKLILLENKDQSKRRQRKKKNCNVLNSNKNVEDLTNNNVILLLIDKGYKFLK